MQCSVPSVLRTSGAPCTTAAELVSLIGTLLCRIVDDASIDEFGGEVVLAGRECAWTNSASRWGDCGGGWDGARFGLPCGPVATRLPSPPPPPPPPPYNAGPVPGALPDGCRTAAASLRRARALSVFGATAAWVGAVMTTHPPGLRGGLFPPPSRLIAASLCRRSSEDMMLLAA